MIAGGGIIPASCIYATEKEQIMSSKWTFIGGILAGIAGVFTAAAVSMELESRKSGSHPAMDDAVGEPERLALPESEGR